MGYWNIDWERDYISKMIKSVLLHLLSIIIYFPLLALLFLELVLRPKKMNDFYLCLDALIKLWEKDRKLKNDKKKVQT